LLDLAFEAGLFMKEPTAESAYKLYVYTMI